MSAVSTGSYDQAAVQNMLQCVFQANRKGSDQVEHVLGFNRKHLNKKKSLAAPLSPQMQVCAEKEHKGVSGA